MSMLWDLMTTKLMFCRPQRREAGYESVFYVEPRGGKRGLLHVGTCHKYVTILQYLASGVRNINIKLWKRNTWPNAILSSGIVAKQLKINRRQPIFKKVGDKRCVSDYRLLAIHSVFRKVFCDVLNERIRSTIKLDDSQKKSMWHR